MPLPEAALYYPQIEPPPGWLNTAALYCRRLATIVPPNSGVPEPLRPLEDLYVPVPAVDAFEDADLEDLERELITVVDGLPISESPDGADDFMWATKLPTPVVRRLLQSERAHREGDLLHTSSRVVSITLSVIADRWCARATSGDQRWAPLTDQPRALRAAAAPIVGYERADLTWVGVDLPRPRGTVPLKRVIEFRRSHEDALERLREEMELLAARAVEMATNPAHVTELYQDLVAEALGEVGQDLKLLGPTEDFRRWIGISGPAAATAAVGAVGEAVARAATPATVAAVVAPIVVQLGTHAFRVFRSERRRRAAGCAPFSYLFAAAAEQMIDLHSIPPPGN